MILYASENTGAPFFLIIIENGMASMPLSASKLYPSKVIWMGNKFCRNARHNTISTNILNDCMPINQ